MASQVQGFELQDVGSVAAASGTVNFNVPVKSGTNKLLIQVAVKYAAVGATPGTTVSFKYSLDGTTYTTSAVAGSSIAPAATVMGVATYEIGIADLVTRKDTVNPLEDYKVTLTNTDATNACQYTILAAWL